MVLCYHIPNELIRPDEAVRFLRYIVNSISVQMNWRFTVQEISANVYKVVGIHKDGRSIEIVGTDPEKLLSECSAEAKTLSDHIGISD